MESKKRTALMDAAVQVVANCGFQGASIGSIVAAAGVAAGTVYVHFESKDHLMLQAYRRVERHCLTAVMLGYPARGSLRERFFHLGYRLIRYFKLFPEEFLFADQFLNSPYLKGASAKSLPHSDAVVILQFFREGVEQRVFKEMPSAMLLALACGPLIQVLRTHAVGFLYLDEERATRTVEACWGTVALNPVRTGNARGKEKGRKENRDGEAAAAPAEEA